MRKYLIAGNWKMNAGPSEASQLIKNIRKELGNSSVKSEVLVARHLFPYQRFRKNLRV